MRLNKVIADAGVVSRRAADRLIEEGRVRINGRVVTELGTRIDGNDTVLVDGRQIPLPARHVYLLLNKPKNTITTTSDERGRRTVMDLVGVRERIFPIGRLDRDTTGALLLTNDGELANRLMHPSYGVPREYSVVLDRPLDVRHAKEIAAGGIELDGGDTTGPCELWMDDRDRTNVQLVLREGKNREVRRLFAHFGYDVKRLDRRAYAGINRRGLARGEWRRLDRREVTELRRLVGLA